MHDRLVHRILVALRLEEVNKRWGGWIRISPHVSQLQQFSAIVPRPLLDAAQIQQ